MSTPRSLAVPAGTSPVRLQLDDHTLAGLDTPAVGVARGTALLVPGFTGSKEDFLSILGPLAGAGYRVITYDQHGQYESPGPDNPAHYTVEALARDLLAVAAVVDDEPVHVVGHSLGGLVARAAALEEPEVLRSLTLLDSGPAAIGEPLVNNLRLFRAVLVEHGLTAVWEGMRAVDDAEGVPPVDDPEVAAFLRRRFFANTPACLAAMAEALTVEPDRVDALAATGLPMLVAHGEREDRWPPSLQEALSARLAARRVVVPDAGHSPAVEQPEMLATALLGFWEDVDAARAA